MLLFTTLSAGGGEWPETGSFPSDRGELVIEAGVDVGRHLVSVGSGGAGDRAEELVSPVGIGPEDEPVSSFHLPPYYRWEAEGLECRFAAEWRDGAPSVAMSLRHMASLRSHPRALVVDDEHRLLDLEGAPGSAIVIGTPATVEHPATGEPSVRVDWRGWHVIDDQDHFGGPVRRILATHTQLFRPQ